MFYYMCISWNGHKLNIELCHFRKRVNTCIIGMVLNKGNNKITELRTILQRESQNS